MAYNNPYQGYYGNSSYGMPYQQQSMYSRQPMYQQPQMQPQPQGQYETPIQDVRFVTSKEAEAYIVMPNTGALLIDANGGIAHYKVANNMGQSVTKFFKFVEVDANGNPIKPQEPTPQVDFNQFAKRDELNGFATIEQYNALTKRQNELLARIEGIQKAMGGRNSGNSRQQSGKEND